MQYRRVRGKAGENRRTRMIRCPIDEPRETRPIRLVGERRRLRFAASDDEPIQLVACQLIEIAISLFDMPGRAFAAR